MGVALMAQFEVLAAMRNPGGTATVKVICEFIEKSTLEHRTGR